MPHQLISCPSQVEGSPTKVQEYDSFSAARCAVRFVDWYWHDAAAFLSDIFILSTVKLPSLRLLRNWGGWVSSCCLRGRGVGALALVHPSVVLTEPGTSAVLHELLANRL